MLIHHCFHTGRLRLDTSTHDISASDDFAVNPRFAVVAAHIADPSFHRHIQDQDVAGHHLFVEAGIVDSNHIKQEAGMPIMAKV